MLQITVPSRELWDEEHQVFISTKGRTLQLEHSLVSLSKWEAKWGKAFLGREAKTHEEALDYVRCMTLTQNVDPMLYTMLTAENIEAVNRYIEAPMTATKFFSEKRSGGSRETITSELIYYWMIALNIPMECQKWHLNRLLTLIKLCNLKNTPPKKHSKREIMSRNAALNAARRKQHRSKG